ncbi:amidohydrolase [Lysobacter sp. HDW10]|uniref:amidohydrolase n=1 Tax=Lysobacter sp. HDW10 TaxID=2714936 RepID=UPI00140888D8|nr:amidohydrolase [Lysobacter sp. HDW10]QIK80951.1 amidohydrolase [Lysobacter sp. HDW10]
MKFWVAAAAACTLLAACTHTPTKPSTAKATKSFNFAEDPYPSTYAALPSRSVLIRHATVLTGTGERIDDGDVLLRNGQVAAVGHDLAVPDDAHIVEANGKWVTPGIIDVHSHLGVYPSPGMNAHSDGNEATQPVTPNVWAEHSVWPQDPGFSTALAAGVTTLQVLPGSANLIGGRGVTLKNVPATTYQAMKFPGAPWGLKMACGENPKRVYASRGPSTRMGNVAGYRAAFADAAEYMKKRNSDGEEGGKRDLKNDTLAGALHGDIRVHIHCYRADEMSTMIDLSKEFGFKIAAFHHAVEAYKIADKLSKEGICGALWADWWGFKMEAFDGIQENVALVDRVPGSCAIVHSDSAEGIQRLNQEAAKVIANARRVGIPVTPEHAIQWITLNPAKSMGIDQRTGSLEVGKMADVVIWNGSPFSSYALAEHVYIDGAEVYDRSNKSLQPKSDFLLGQDLMTGGAR